MADTNSSTPFVYTEQKAGDVIRSTDWNAANQEIARLEAAKVNYEGENSLAGPLTIKAALAVAGPSTLTGNVGIGTTSSKAKLDVNGAIHAGTSDIYFTDTEHNHSQHGNKVGHAAIENAQDYKALMILGRNMSSSGADRRVKLFDHLEVNGALKVEGTGSSFAGSLGVGTTNPEKFKLRVAGDFHADRIVVHNRSEDGDIDGGKAGIWMWNGGDSSWGIYMGASGGQRSLASKPAVAGAGFTQHALRLRTNAGNIFGLIYENSKEELNLSVRASDGMTYVRGNVGIGTEDPRAKLDVNGNASFTGTLQVTNDAYFATRKGNVGIGTTSPTEKLEIQGGKLRIDGGQQIVFKDADTSNNLKLQLWNGYGLGINGGTLFYAANGKHSWRDNAGVTERMALTTGANGGLTVKGTGISSFAGSLGIGTENPQAKLDVKGAIHAGNSDIYFTDTEHIHSGYGNTSGYAAIENAKNFDALMILGRAGTLKGRQVQLWDYLNVNGSLGVTNNTNTMTVSVNRKGVTLTLAKSHHSQSEKTAIWDGDNNWDFPSDLRLKQDVEKEQNILERLIQLDVKNYRWKDEHNAPKQIGMVAQDVQPLFPALVGNYSAHELQNEATLTLKYGCFGVLAIGGLKELKLEKDIEVARLEKEINNLKAKLEAMISS